MTSRQHGSYCSNHSYTHAASDPLPLKRLRTSSSSHTPPQTCPAAAACDLPIPNRSCIPASHLHSHHAAACTSPQSDACAPSQGSQQKNRTYFTRQNGHQADMAHTSMHDTRGGTMPEDTLDATSTLPRLLAQYGHSAQVPTASSMGVFGQAILVASRLGAYSRAAWELVVAAGAQTTGVGRDGPPLARYCEALKVLVRHSILQRVEVLHGSVGESKAAAISLLQHVLLWQYLKHRSIMGLVEMVLEKQDTAGDGDGQHSARGAQRRSAFDTDDTTDSSGSCFLLEVGVPLVREAMEQAKTDVKFCGVAPGSAERTGPWALHTLDITSVLSMIYQSSRLRSPTCTQSTVEALSGDVDALHRVSCFLSKHQALVTQILSGVDHTPQQLLLVFMALTHASALLTKEPTAAIAADSAPAVIAARAALAQYNAVADERQRSAKAGILDARICAARSAAWNKDVAACTVKAAVSKAFRQAYLFTELKDLLQQWTPMLDSVLDCSALTQEAAHDAQAAASAAFDVSTMGLRFRVPSAGFLLIWTTSPHSRAHSSRCGDVAVVVGPRVGAGVRRVPSDGLASVVTRKRHPASQRPTRSDDVLVQLGRPPPGSPHAAKIARTASQEWPGGTTSSGAGAAAKMVRPGSKIGNMGPPPDMPDGWQGAKRARGSGGGKVPQRAHAK